MSLLNENGAVHGEISEVLNHEFLVHQIKNKVFELHKVTHYIVSKMLQLCAPVRDAEIRLIENSSSMGAALVNILDMIQVLKLDMANFRLETIKPFLKNEAIGFEHKKFKEALENKNVKLENTRVWLERAFEQLKNTVEQRNPEQIENLELKFKFSRVLDQAYLSLLFSPTAIDPSTLPETLKLDASRLFSFQNELQAVAVTAAVVHLAQNLVPVLKRESLVLKQLAKNMFRLLNESTTNLETISGLIVDTANQVLHQQSKQMAELSNLTSNPTAQKLVELPQEKITLVHSMVEKTLSLKDPFLNVICRRIEKITRLYLEDEGKKRGFASNGLGIVEQELETLLKKIGMVTKYNRNVYGEYYDQLLSQLK